MATQLTLGDIKKQKKTSSAPKQLTLGDINKQSLGSKPSIMDKQPALDTNVFNNAVNRNNVTAQLPNLQDSLKAIGQTPQGQIAQAKGLAGVEQRQGLVQEQQALQKKLIPSLMPTKPTLERAMEDKNIQNKIIKIENQLNPKQKQSFESTLAKLGADLGTGFLSTAENVADALLVAGAYGFDKLGNKDIAKIMQGAATQKPTQMVTTPAQDLYSKESAYGKGSFVENVAQGVGQVAGLGAAGKLLGGASKIGLIPTAPIISGIGSGTVRGLEKGANLDTALAYGITSGTVEGVSEALAGGIGGVIGKGALDDVVIKKIASKFSSKLGQNLVTITGKAGFEGLEENIVGLIDPYLQRMTVDERAKLYSGDEALMDFLVGAVTSAVLQSPSINQQQNFTDVLERPKVELPQTNINTPTNVETLSKTPEIASKQPVMVSEVEKVMQNRNATVEDATKAIMTDNKLEPRYESAIKHILNLNQLTKKDTPAIDLVVKELPKTKTGMTIDGYLDGDTIVLNTNVNNPIMETTIHEGVHFLRNSENYDDMKDYVLTTLDKQGQLTKLFNEVEQTYAPIYEKEGRKLTDDVINDEIIANFYAKNGLANENFINKLANDNRNIAQKIYDFVKNKVTEMSKISKMTAEERETYEFYKKAEKLYVKALKGKFEASTNGKQMSVSNTPKPTKEVKPIDKTAIRSVPKTISGSLDKKTIDVAGNLEYVVQTDKQSLRNAKKEIKDIGYEELLTAYQTKFKKNERFTKDDFVTMGLLINEARQKGDIVAQVDLVTTLAIMSTESGQTNQSISVIRSLGPEGRAISVMKYLQRQNTTLKNKKGFTEIKLPQELLDKIINSKNSNDTDLAVSNAIQHITDQVPLTWKERIKNWRYMSMLTNIVTHLRNVTSNVAMAGTQRSKDVMAAGMEDIIKPMQRTKTLKKATKDQSNYAKKDYEVMRERLNNINSYDLNQMAKSQKRFFDTKWLNAIAKFNSDILSAEDNFFKRLAYTKAAKNYMAANNLTSEYLESGTKQSQKELEKMREYATIQSLEATFQQDNSLANFLNEAKKHEFKSQAGTVAKDMLLGATIPFTKTPANILVTGVEYNPVGVITGVYKVLDNVANNKMTGDKAIDTLAKGMTGTSITALGAYLAAKGILNGSGGDEDELDKQLGKQPYSLNVGGKTYSLNWLSPVGIPLFFGVELQKLASKDESFDFWKAVEGASGMLDPMTEMSMLQGLDSTMKSYGDSALGGVGVNALQNYTSQFYPSLFARIAKITDDKQRNITSTSTNALEKKYETYINAQINKVPFLNKTLQPKYDIWGREISTGDATARVLQNLASPGFLRDNKKDNVSKELNRLFKNDIKAFPNFASDYFTANKKEINLTEEQWAKRIKLDGETSYKALSQLFNSKYYKSLPETSDDRDKMTKEKAIKSVYDYADNVAKAQFIKDEKTKRDLKKTINRSETKLWNLFDIKKRG